MLLKWKIGNLFGKQLQEECIFLDCKDVIEKEYKNSLNYPFQVKGILIDIVNLGNFSNDFVKKCHHLLEKNTKLEIFGYYLSKIHNHQQYVIPLLECLKLKDTVKHFMLRYLCDEDLSKIVFDLLLEKNYESIDLECCESPNFSFEISRLLLNNCKMTFLNIGDYLRDYQIYEIAEAIKRNTSLIELHISSKKEDLEILKDALKFNFTLQKIDIRTNSSLSELEKVVLDNGSIIDWLESSSTMSSSQSHFFSKRNRYVERNKLMQNCARRSTIMFLCLQRRHRSKHLSLIGKDVTHLVARQLWKTKVDITAKWNNIK